MAATLFNYTPKKHQLPVGRSLCLQGQAIGYQLRVNEKTYWACFWSLEAFSLPSEIERSQKNLCERWKEKCLQVPKKSSAVNNREKLFFPPQLMIRAKLSCRVFPAKLLFVKAGGVVAIIRDTWLISLEKCMLCRTFEI